MAHAFPSPRMRLFLAAYGLLWSLGLPVVLLYLRRRARRDRDYTRHLAERFGRYHRALPGSVWVHAVSLGELRSAVPLIRALLAQGDTVVTTHFTPAGRREAERIFAREIAANRLQTVWIPLEFSWVYRRFFTSFQPRYGLVMEIEIWPRMIAACHRNGIPLLMCNAQYPSKSYARDTTRLGLRAELMTGFAGALVKSDLQARRFASVGVRNIRVTGELRFDQPIPDHLVAAGLSLRRWAGAAHRPVIALASVVAGEDALMIAAIRGSIAAHRRADRPAPLFLYIPRAPENFGPVAARLSAEGLALARRSTLLTESLSPRSDPPAIDVLLCDSLGEMYAWLAMADRVVVGGGFTPKGSHNISEALALGKPVIVGPDIHTIEYPALEAIEAGVCRRLERPQDLAAALSPDAPQDPSAETITAFLAAHSGAVARTLQALPGLVTSR